MYIKIVIIFVILIEFKINLDIYIYFNSLLLTKQCFIPMYIGDPQLL